MLAYMMTYEYGERKGKEFAEATETSADTVEKGHR